MALAQALTPVQIVQELNKYIIGQEKAKRAVAVALRNRWRRLEAETDLQREIIPNNILMIGSTGVGKTEIARRLAQLAEAPFVKVEASKFTEVGYVGRDVESMVRDLVEQSINLIREEKRQLNEAKALELAEERILDIIIPPIRRPGNAEPSGSTPLASDSTPLEGGVGFGSADDFPKRPSRENAGSHSVEDVDLNERTREKFREKLRSGELDERTVDVEVTVPQHNLHVMGPQNNMEMEGLQDMLQTMMPKKKQTRKMKVKDAREFMKEEEADKLIDQETLQREALERAANAGIIFIDEIDKVAAKRGQGGPDVSREGVQRDMLPIIEGSAVNTKYGTLRTDHVLFIAAGAFHVSKPSDLIPELQGRLPIRVTLEDLTRDDFIKILQQPKNALTKQYQALLATEGVTLHFREDAIEALADLAFKVNTEVENIGARRLQTLLSNLLEDILFNVPDLDESREFLLTAEHVNERVGKLARQQDVSAYIL